VLASAMAVNNNNDYESSAVEGGGVASLDGPFALQSYTYNSSTGNLASNAGVSYPYGQQSCQG
jgi:hypothetical protein